MKKVKPSAYQIETKEVKKTILVVGEGGKEGKAYSFCKSIYSKLVDDSESSQGRAIEYAKKLYKDQSDLVYHDQNPITKVYELVEYLNQNIRP